MTKTAQPNVEHADLMDSVYSTQRHIYDLTRKYYLLGRDRAIKELSPNPGDTILEVGCGTGRNLIKAARQYPNCKFFGIDISSEMLATANKNIRKAGLQNQIALAQGDASNFDAQHLFNKTKFDRILMSYTLSMIPPWEAAMAQSLDLLDGHGKLVFVDFWNLSDLPNWSKTALRFWLDLFHVSARENLEDTAKTIAENSQRNCAFTPLYRGYACLGTIT